jgi:hypothetical protein
MPMAPNPNQTEETPFPRRVLVRNAPELKRVYGRALTALEPTVSTARASFWYSQAWWFVRSASQEIESCPTYPRQ